MVVTVADELCDVRLDGSHCCVVCLVRGINFDPLEDGSLERCERVSVAHNVFDGQFRRFNLNLDPNSTSDRTSTVHPTAIRDRHQDINLDCTSYTLTDPRPHILYIDWIRLHILYPASYRLDPRPHIL